MITDDEVMRVLERADPARCDDVAPLIDAAGYLDALRTRTTTVALVDDEPTRPERTGRHRWSIVTTAAAAVLLIVVGALIVTTRDEEVVTATDQTPALTEAKAPSTKASADVDSLTRRGLIGLPPEGATPSRPEHGQLVDEYFVARGGYRFAGYVRLYADGRVIWRMYTTDHAGSSSTGWLEQRLTPEGVALVRTHEVMNPLSLQQWLPETAWEDQQLRAFVPSGFAACLGVGDGVAAHSEIETPGYVPLEQLLAMLPAPAEDLLRGKQYVPQALGTREERWDACLALTTEEARLLDRILREAGIEHDDTYQLQYHVDYPGHDGFQLGVYLEPVFPDGSVTCSGCG